jgi:hypothetical protein
VPTLNFTLFLYVLPPHCFLSRIKAISAFQNPGAYMLLDLSWGFGFDLVGLIKISVNQNL